MLKRKYLKNLNLMIYHLLKNKLKIKISKNLWMKIRILKMIEFFFKKKIQKNNIIRPHMIIFNRIKKKMLSKDYQIQKLK